jgi:hypothetical protein
MADSFYVNGNQIIQIQLSNKRGKVKKYQKVRNKTFWGGGRRSGGRNWGGGGVGKKGRWVL